MIKIYGQEDLNKARELAKQARDLHLAPPCVTFYEGIIKDPSGEVVDHILSKSNSWVRNGLNMLACITMLNTYLGGAANYGAGYLNVKRTDNTILYGANGIYAPWHNLAECGAAGASGEGIVVGSGSAAESFEDHVLGTKIAHGTGAGQLSYGALSSVSTAWNAGTSKWSRVLQRVFTNNTGNNVTISEIGYYMQGATIGGNAYSDAMGFMIIRDLLPSSVVLANGQSYTVTYTFEFAF
jgi:hypothetical protein